MANHINFNKTPRVLPLRGAACAALSWIIFIQFISSGLSVDFQELTGEPNVVIVPLGANRAGSSRQNFDPVGGPLQVQDPDVAFVGLLDGLNIQDRYNIHGSEFRKKRTISSFTESLDAMCPKETTTTEKPNGFWCSPFYLRLNPIMYLPCRLSGHHNLHFF